MQYRTYQDAEGTERGVVEIVAGDVQFLGKRPAILTPDDESIESTATSGHDAEHVSPDEIPF